MTTLTTSAWSRRRTPAQIACAILLSAYVVSVSGCAREWYRQQADDEATSLIDEKSYVATSQWQGVDSDPRSRFHDAWDPVRPPMPPDDPQSHRLMHHVDGMDGWEHWHDNGSISQLENPDWREQLPDYVQIEDDGSVKLDLGDAVRLATIHSPGYQQQVETLYLSALDVSTERFRFDTQFLGGFSSANTGFGGGGSRSFFNDTAVGVTGDATKDGNSFDVSNKTDIQLRRRFATAGQLVVGFTNNLVWQFSGGNTSMAGSVLNFNLVQPLLRAGGRQIALEQLTIVERTLLANVRAFDHYRQGFYTQVAIGQSGTTGPSRRGGFQGGSGLSGFSGQGAGGFGGVGDATGFGRGSGGNGGDGGGGIAGSGFAGGGAGQVGGFIGLLQRQQQIRNTETSLRAQQQMLLLLEEHVQGGLIDLAQVDQFRQSIETERANLLQSRNGYLDTLESFKSFTLGLPPDLPVDLDNSLILPFRFLDPELAGVQTSMQALIDDFGQLAEEPEVTELATVLARIVTLQTRIREQLEIASTEIQNLENVRDARTQSAGVTERQQFDRDREQLSSNLTALRERLAKQTATVEALQEDLAEGTRAATVTGIVGINVELTGLLSELTLIQARSRLEAVTLDTVSIDSADALEIARAHRLDWMNNRAALVDTWRLIEFNANRLESNLDVVLSGNLGTVGNNTVKFSGEDTNISAGLQFDTPFNRLVERNDFRQQLIFYQQSRRQLIQFEDGIHRGLRSLLRELEQLQLNLEIQRRAVAISIRRVDQTRENLNRPTPPLAPGQPVPTFGPTAALNLLTALSDLRSSQNNFMSVWLNYYAGRMRLIRELGLMQIDDEGQWVARSLEESLQSASAPLSVPPPIHDSWLKLVDEPPDESEDGTTPPPNGEPPVVDDDANAPQLRPAPASDEAAIQRVPPKTRVQATGHWTPLKKATLPQRHDQQPARMPGPTETVKDATIPRIVLPSLADPIRPKRSASGWRSTPQ